MMMLHRIYCLCMDDKILHLSKSYVDLNAMMMLLLSVLLLDCTGDTTVVAGIVDESVLFAGDNAVGGTRNDSVAVEGFFHRKKLLLGLVMLK